MMGVGAWILLSDDEPVEEPSIQVERFDTPEEEEELEDVEPI